MPAAYSLFVDSTFDPYRPWFTEQPEAPYLGEDEMSDEEFGEMLEEYVVTCPACGNVIDYCQGHGDIGDPEGFRILSQHDDDNHTLCHPNGCEEIPLHRDCSPTWCEESHEPNSRCPEFHG